MSSFIYFWGDTANPKYTQKLHHPEQYSYPEYHICLYLITISNLHGKPLHIINIETNIDLTVDHPYLVTVSYDLGCIEKKLGTILQLGY